MKKRLLHDYLEIGYSTAALRYPSSEFMASDLIAFAANWQRGLKEQGLTVSAELVEDVIFKFFESIFPKNEVDSYRVKNTRVFSNIKLADFQIEHLKNGVDEVMRAVQIELQSVFVFSVAEKRYSFDKLYSNLGALFSNETFSVLPEIAQYDFEEAGKCIVFERPTAAAFHSLRAVECVLKQFYKKQLSKEPAENATWGDMGRDLKQFQPSIDSAIIEQLTHIRKRYRNQTQHPRLRYDIEESQDLFNICIELVNNLSRGT